MAIKKILISQETPMNKAPYDSLVEKFGVQIDFKPFFLIEPLTSREFRTQRLNILDFTAIVFSARHTIDAFFRICEELRVKVPETMKYFCTTEAVAMYLQKHIVFRKRKIFYGNGTPSSVIDLIGPKHKGEKFLIATSDSSNVDTLTRLFQAQGLDYTTSVFVKSVPQDLKDVDLESYDLVVFYNPADLKSLYANFPEFKPGNARFVTFGKQIVKAMEEAGLPVEIQAPTPEAPSVARALELYLGNHS
ncbi:MAG: uroporphyrinogen-III synthase [Candidatus Cryptobacteroides sp.]